MKVFRTLRPVIAMAIFIGISAQSCAVISKTNEGIRSKMEKLQPQKPSNGITPLGCG